MAIRIGTVWEVAHSAILARVLKTAKCRVLAKLPLVDRLAAEWVSRIAIVCRHWMREAKVVGARLRAEFDGIFLGKTVWYREP